MAEATSFDQTGERELDLGGAMQQHDEALAHTHSV
jgi:hypothetical protein